MSFFGKLIGDILRVTSTQPYGVEDVKLEYYLSYEVVLAEDIIKLINVRGTYECVLYPPGQTNGIGYSMFRVGNLVEAENCFQILAPRLSLLVRAEKNLAYKSTLQQLSSVLKEHPTWTCAHVAAWLGHTTCFRHPEIIPQLSAQDSQLLTTPIHLAVQSGNQRTVTELLLLNVRLDITDAQGNSAFHLAANTNADMIKFLANKNRVMLNYLNSFGESPLHNACRAGRADLVEVLMFWGADPRVSQAELFPIHCAVEKDDLACVQVLYNRYPDVLQQQDVKLGATPIHWARSKEVAMFLLQNNCDMYSLNRFGDTPLNFLTSENRPECAMAMLTHGADTNRKGKNGYSPLHSAIQTDNIDLIRAFIVFGVNVDAINDNKETARHLTEKTRAVNRDLILHTLHEVGARRCDKSMSGCTDGCKDGGANNGRPPPRSVLPMDVRNQLYDDLLGAAIISAALVDKQRRHSLDVVDGPVEPRGLNVLSLDGGGIRGMILIQILLELEKFLVKPIKECFDWIAGTSTGGILALAITYGKSMKYTQGLYFHLKDEVFKGKRPYDSEPLERFMKREFGEHTNMNAVEYPRVMVSGVLGDRHPAELHFFTNYERPLVDHDDTIIGQCQKHLKKPLHPVPKPKDQLVWRAGRCSGAAPTYFRACGRFLDGGLIANNPCLDLLTEIHEYNTMCAAKEKPELVRRIRCMVSLGTGKIPLEEVTAVDVFRPEGVFELWKTAMGAQNLATLLVDQATDSEGRSVDRSRAWCGMAQIPFFRFSPPLSEAIPLDARDDSVVLKMLWETKAYLYNNRSKLSQLAELLKS